MEQQIFPILGTGNTIKKWLKINLEQPFLQMRKEELPVHYLYRILDEIRKLSGKQIFWGGYLEKRIYYGQSRHFSNEVINRNIHLGIDIWSLAGTPIFAPINASVHSLKYNDNELDYGGTIILQLEDGSYLLFGHLSISSLEYVANKKDINRGENFAWLGCEKENGGWPPHLHIQHILDIEEWNGDYPGVINKEKLQFYKANCPDPYPFIAGINNDEINSMPTFFEVF